MLNIALAKRNEINSKESGIYTFPPNFPAGTLGLDINWDNVHTWKEKFKVDLISGWADSKRGDIWEMGPRNCEGGGGSRWG